MRSMASIGARDKKQKEKIPSTPVKLPKLRNLNVMPTFRPATDSAGSNIFKSWCNRGICSEKTTLIISRHPRTQPSMKIEKKVSIGSTLLITSKDIML